MEWQSPLLRDGVPADGMSARRCASPQLVSVVIPAFNAARTIEATLRSACAQTYPNLEIIVVNDGSTDATASIVRRMRADDWRVRMIATPNRGVACARNEGIMAARGAYIAMLDADDLWHPAKIERQMSVMLSSPVKPAFVYCLYRNIDAAGLVTHSASAVACRGAALTRHVYVNFVGNGSSLLLRRTAIEAVGGYDPGLRAQGIEGCEDLLLQLRIASRFNVDYVPEYLVAYRQHPAMMSFDQTRMLESRLAALALVREIAPHVPGFVFRWSLAQQFFHTFLSDVRRGRWIRAARMLALSMLNDPRATIPRIWATLRPKPRPRTHFHDYFPSEGTIHPSRLLTGRLRRLAAFDTPGASGAPAEPAATGYAAIPPA